MPPARRVSYRTKRFGAIIERLRRARGWTVTKLAGRARMDAAYVRRVEKGKNTPSIDTILELAEVLGVDPGEIVREVAGLPKPAPPPVDAPPPAEGQPPSGDE